MSTTLEVAPRSDQGRAADAEQAKLAEVSGSLTEMGLSRTANRAGDLDQVLRRPAARGKGEDARREMDWLFLFRAK